MLFPQWIQLFSGRTAPAAKKGRRTRPTSQGRRLRLETLEDRTLPATSITIIATCTGTLDHFLSATNRTITTAGGSLTFGAGTSLPVASLNTAGGAVSLTATAGQVLANAISTSGGNVGVTADAITLQGTVNAGQSSSASIVTLVPKS